MRQRLALAFLILYVLALTRPLYPMVKDGLAHLLWERQHLAHVHSHYGEFHVHEEVKKIEEEKTPLDTKSPQANVSEESLSFHLTNPVVFNFFVEASSRSYTAHKPIAINFIYLDVFAPPPDRSIS